MSTYFFDSVASWYSLEQLNTDPAELTAQGKDRKQYNFFSWYFKDQKENYLQRLYFLH